MGFGIETPTVAAHGHCLSLVCRGFYLYRSPHTHSNVGFGFRSRILLPTERTASDPAVNRAHRVGPCCQPSARPNLQLNTNAEQNSKCLPMPPLAYRGSNWPPYGQQKYLYHQTPLLRNKAPYSCAQSLPFNRNSRLSAKLTARKGSFLKSSSQKHL